MDQRQAAEARGSRPFPPLPSGAKYVEVEFGESSVTAPQPATNTSLRIDFNASRGATRRKTERRDRAIEKKEYRFAHNCADVMRNADISDLNDPGLGLIQRRILETSNRLFGEPLLQEILVSGFSLVDQ